MIKSLRDSFSINPFVILPCDGDGSELLKSLNINFKVIKSVNWTIPLYEIKYLDKIEENQKSNLKAINIIKKFIKDKKINLIHINDSCSYIGAETAISGKIPFVWQIRECLEEDYCYTLWDRKYGNKLINKSNTIIVSSNDIYKKYENTFDKKKLVCIYDEIPNIKESIEKESLDDNYSKADEIFEVYTKII